MFERGAGQDRAALRFPRRRELRQVREPGPAIGVVEREVGRHFGAIFRRVVVVRVVEREPETRGEQLSDRRFATASHSHDEHEHFAFSLRALTAFA